MFTLAIDLLHAGLNRVWNYPSDKNDGVSIWFFWLMFVVQFCQECKGFWVGLCISVFIYYLAHVNFKPNAPRKVESDYDLDTTNLTTQNEDQMSSIHQDEFDDLDEFVTID